MANYIKVPLAVNPPRSFNLGALSGTATGGGTVSGSGASAAQDIVGGSGSGAKATVTKGGDATIATATITISSNGEGYKVGDVVTIAALTSGGATQWTAEISYTIKKADLIESDGTVTNDYVLIDIDKVLCVDPFGSAINFYQNIPSQNPTQTPPEKPQQLKLKLDHASANPELDLAGRDVADAMVKAIQAPNSVPTVVWTDPDIEALTLEQSA